MSVDEERCAQRDERHRRGHGGHEALPHAPERATTEAAQRLVRDVRRCELEDARHRRAHRDVGGQRRGAHHGEHEQHEREIGVRVERLRPQLRNERGEGEDEREPRAREREMRRDVVEREHVLGVDGGRAHRQ